MHREISVVFLVKDEFARLGPALESVAWAEEVLVVDTGSTDGTPELARRSGARVVKVPWEGWVASRNRALAEARNDWVLFVDADERVSPELGLEIEALLSRDGDRLSGATFPRLSHLGPWPIRHGTWYPDVKLRLARRSKGFRVAGGRVHETFQVEGPVAALKNPLLHFPYSGVRDYMAKASLYAELSARDRFDAGRRASTSALALRPLLEFLRCYVLKRGFLDGRRGFWVAVCHSFSYFLRASYLLELGRRAESSAREPRPVEAARLAPPVAAR